MATAAFSSATAATISWGSWDRVIFAAVTWTAGKTWTVAGVSDQGQFNLGIGFLGADHSAAAYNTALVMGKRVFIGQANQVAFSAISNSNPVVNGADGWNQQDTGAGVIPFLDQQGLQDVANGLAIFQGRLAVLGRYNIQIWNVNADPAQFSLVQILVNQGTPSPRSVQGTLGELDVLFYDDSGVRSLRTLVTTLNATQYDIGAAIDYTIQQQIFQNVSDLTTIMSLVEPLTKRYWISIGTVFFVLSYYPQAKIQAWGQYNAADSSQATFTPQWATLYQGQVVIRGDNNTIYIFGGLASIVGAPTYDNNNCSWTLPWLDHKTPKTRKQSLSVGAAFAGNWTVTAAMQLNSVTATTVISKGGSGAVETSDSALDLPVYPYSEDGTHIQFIGNSTTAGTFANPVKFSLLVWNYDLDTTE